MSLSCSIHDPQSLPVGRTGNESRRQSGGKGPRQDMVWCQSEQELLKEKKKKEETGERERRESMPWRGGYCNGVLSMLRGRAHVRCIHCVESNKIAT